MFIQIVADPQTTFTYRPRDPDTNQPMDTELELRLVPEDVQKQLRKQFESVEWRRGQRIVTVDEGRWAERCVQYAIVGWKDLYSVTVKDGAVVARTAVPCEDRYKALLPEHVKVEVVRLCVAREAGSRLAEGAFEEPEASEVAADPLRR